MEKLMTKTVKYTFILAIILNANISCLWAANDPAHTANPVSSATASDKKLYNEDNKNVMITAKDHSFKVVLKSNPTTGFSWFLRDYDENLIAPLSHQFVKPDQKLAGAPGSEIFTFTVKPAAMIVPTQTLLRLSYARPFSDDESGNQITFRISTAP